MNASAGVDGWLASAGRDHLLDRVSVPERVAGLLRQMITDGAVGPGDRLSDDELSTRLSMSRNTVREAFRLLGHEGLLVHELNRGVFVRTLAPEDVADIYRFRRVLECAAVRAAGDAPPAVVEEMAARLHEGQQAADAQRWRDVGTANIRFHRAIGRLLGSSRVDTTMDRLLAELRLAFHVIDDPRTLHGPFLPRNQHLLSLLQRGALTEAEQELDRYLAEAQQQLVAAYSARM